MKEKAFLIILALLFSIVSVTASFATEGPQGNKRKGKYTYRKVYKTCMATGEVESATPSISPADKKRADWDDIFQNRKFDEFGCVTQWAELEDQAILDIYSYFWNFAADSPSPATCK